MNYIGFPAFSGSPCVRWQGWTCPGGGFCALFAETGILGRSFKVEVRQVISNDLEFYSFVLNRNYIGYHQVFFYHNLLDELNALEGKRGFISEQYAEKGRAQRLYFSEANEKNRRRPPANRTLEPGRPPFPFHAMFFLL